MFIPPLIHSAKRFVYIINPNQLGYKVLTHSNCICNELVALTNRHIIDRSYINYDEEFIRHGFLKFGKKFIPKQHLTKVSFSDIINEYKGGKKREYMNAYQVLMHTGFLRKYAKVKMFIKPDRYCEQDIDSKAPRAIQFRRKEFNLCFSRYIKAIENYLYPNLFCGVVSDTQVIVKCLNPYQRAELLIKKSEYFKYPVYLLLDHSKFDSTINEHHLSGTHRLYYKLIPDQFFHKLCKMQKKNDCWSAHGIHYKTKGTRMSGDSDTALGNSLVNAVCLYTVLKYSNISKYDIMLDGDDSIVIIEHSQFKNFRHELFELFGFETKFEHTTDIFKAEFCQSRLVIASSPCFVRNPLRIFSNTTVAIKKYDLNYYRNWLSANGMCELALNRGVPLIQDYALSLIKLAKPIFEREHLVKLKDLKCFEYVKPELTAYITLYYSWGIPIDLQDQLYEYLKPRYTYCDYCAYYRLKYNIEYFKSAAKKKFVKFYIKCHVQSILSRERTRAFYEAIQSRPGESWWFLSN